MNGEAKTPPPPDRRFLHTLTPVDNRTTPWSDYDIAGQRWTSFSYPSRDALLHHRGDDILEVASEPSGRGFAWTWCRKLAEDAYARTSGKSDTVEAACAAALAYAPIPCTFHYLGETAWLETAPGDWIAALDGDEAHIRFYGEQGYGWTRNWPPAAAVLNLAGDGSGLSGWAPTLEAAMQACIDAPERFKRACAAMVMQVTR